MYKMLTDKEKINYATGLIVSVAILNKYKDAKLNQVLATEKDFNVDLDLNRQFVSTKDYTELEEIIKSLLEKKLVVETKAVDLNTAKEIFKDNPYKLKQLLEFDNNVPLIYVNDLVDINYGGVEDILIGSTVKNTFYELLNSSSAYYENNANNKQLDRINGIGFKNKTELKEFKAKLEEAKKRDHRKIGRELDLFMFDDTAPGMPYWLPNGLILFNNLVDFWRDVHKKNNYLEFSAPQLNNSELWKTSGHWDHYKNDMFVFNDADGSKKRPVMLHRVIYGSIERFIGILIEHYAGAFPLWLSPVQINVIPVNNEYHLQYSKKVVKELKLKGFRVELDDRNEKLGYKMRESQTKKTPLTLILGDQERDNNTISYRKFGQQETITKDIFEFINELNECISSKNSNL